MRHALTFLCLLVLIFPPPGVAGAGDIINVAVSILPQKYFVERIGGERIRVLVMVRPGLNPETYEPTPRQMTSIHEAQLYFRIGVPFEKAWMENIKRLNSRLRVIECCHELFAGHIPDHAHIRTEHSVNHDLDAHVWTSPENVKIIADQIKSVLIEFDPAHQDIYEKNYKAFSADIDELDHSIRTQLANLKNRYLFVSHPSWGYYADAYGLKQISIERNGGEIRAREMARLIDLAREQDIRAVYVQKQFNIASAEVLAREIKAEVVELDPLAEDYIENLQQVTQAIVRGAGQRWNR
jgi:zinc transport system substrate-binding protein